MNSLIDDDEFDREEGRDRELTLSTGAILGIFLGLVVVCGAFFGLGYKMGSHKPTPILASEPVAPTSNTDFSGFKSSASTSAPKPTAGTSTIAHMPTPEPTADEPPAQPAPNPRVAAAPPPATVHTPAPVPVTPPARTPTPVDLSTPVPTGSFVVQIAAISVAHQADADMLVSALRAKGYAAAARTEPQDKLLHIQVGPFRDRKQADDTKQRLSADGYNNPIVK